MGIFRDKLSDSGHALPFALELTNDAVTLFARQPDRTDAPWQELGRAVLGAPDFDEQIDSLRVETIVRSSRRDPILLWLPPEQIISRVAILSTDSNNPAALTESANMVASETDYDVRELCVAISPGRRDEPVRVLGALLQTVHEAQSYAERWGFGASIVSARDPDSAFGVNGAHFRTSPSYSARAGRRVRRTAVAAAAVVALGIGGVGTYQLVRPLVEAAPGLSTTAPKIASFAVVLDPIYGAVSPLKGVRIGSAEALSLQAVFVPDDDRVRAFATGKYVNPAATGTLPDLMPPGEGSQMQVGGAPISPARDLPGHLAAAEDGATQPRTIAMRRALAKIRDEGLAAASERDGAGTASKTTDAAAPDPVDENTADKTAQNTPTEDPVPTASDEGPAPETLAALSAPGSLTELGGGADRAALDTEPTDQQTDPQGAAEEEGSDRGSMAPVSVEAAPTPRPGSLKPAEPKDDEPTQSPSLAGDAVSTPDDTAPDVAVAPPKPDRASPEPATDAQPNAAVATAAATPTPKPVAKQQADDAVGEGDGEAPQADAVAEDNSVFAAASAPQPRSRPPGAVRAAPKRLQRSAKSVAGKVPESARSAERTGLDLDATLLIGVIESRRGRQALVRTSKGDFRKVARGDLVDGWRVRSIDREAMRLTRSGKNRTLLLVGR